MTGIYWGASGGPMRMKTYSSATKATGETTIKVELVTTDPYDVASLLRQLAEIKEEQDAARTPAPATSRRTRRQPDTATAISAAPPLKLTYRSGNE